MTAASDALLGIGLLVVMASALGMALLRDPLDRVHLVTPASTVGVVAVCAAVVVRDGLSATGTSAVLVAVMTVGSSPFVSHAIARSIWLRDGRERATGGGGSEAPGPPGDGHPGAAPPPQAGGAR